LRIGIVAFAALGAACFALVCFALLAFAAGCFFALLLLTFSLRGLTPLILTPRRFASHCFAFLIFESLRFGQALRFGQLGGTLSCRTFDIVIL
jgi:hypothetical protein